MFFFFSFSLFLAHLDRLTFPPLEAEQGAARGPVLHGGAAWSRTGAPPRFKQQGCSRYTSSDSDFRFGERAPGSRMIHRADFYIVFSKSQKLHNVHTRPIRNQARFQRGCLVLLFTLWTQHAHQHCCRKWIQQCPVVLHIVLCTGLLTGTGSSIVIDARI